MALEFYVQQDVEGPISEALWRAWFEVWLKTLGLDGSVEVEVSLCLTSDAHIQSLNARYRDVDAPTDVLAFAVQETPLPPRILMESDVTILGDIVISVPTAIRQAHDRDHSLTRELAWLAVHGLLHLLGWDHPDDEALERMLAEQYRLLEAIHLSGGHV